MIPPPQVAIVGVGLMGGSLGLALKKRGLAGEIVGIGRRQESLDVALERGAITRGTTELADGVAAADVVVVATPVARVADDVCTAVAAAPSGVLVTDVASTKTAICRELASRLPIAARFVGSHPLAGDHRTGPENARDDLFVGRTVVVTPTDTTPGDVIDEVREFWEAIGGRVVQMPPDAHDQALAATSHLPHLVASALAAVTPEEFLPLAATGWGDTTRIAAGDPQLWTQIFAQNAVGVVERLDLVLVQLQSLREQLDSADWPALEHTLKHAKRIRDALGN